jgi:hypothetical protein
MPEMPGIVEGENALSLGDYLLDQRSEICLPRLRILISTKAYRIVTGWAAPSLGRAQTEHRYTETAG